MNFLRRQAFSAGSAGRVLLLGILVSALGAQVSETQRPIGIPEDWSHHHIIFTRSALAPHPELAAQEVRVTHRMWREMATLLRYRNPIRLRQSKQPGLERPPGHGPYAQRVIPGKVRL